MKAKKYIQIFGVLLVVLGWSHSVIAVPDLTISSGNGLPGDTINIAVDYVSDGTVVTLQFQVIYDPTQLSPGTIISGAAAPHSVLTNVVTPGTIQVLVPLVLQNPIPIVATATPLATIPFIISQSAASATTPISFNNVVLGNAVGAPVSPTSTSTGQINIQNTGQIIIAKQTNPPGNPTAFNFSLTGGPSGLNQAFTLTDGNSFNSGAVIPGNGYNAVETVPAGWNLVGTTCDDGSAVSNIDVASGEVVTCTFTNDQITTPPPPPPPPPPTVQGIPTLSQWGIILLGIFLFVTSVLNIRAKR